MPVCCRLFFGKTNWLLASLRCVMLMVAAICQQPAKRFLDCVHKNWRLTARIRWISTGKLTLHSANFWRQAASEAIYSAVAPVSGYDAWRHDMPDRASGLIMSVCVRWRAWARQLNKVRWQNSWDVVGNVSVVIWANHFWSKQGVALTGRNTTGPPRAAPWWVTMHMRVLQTTTTTTNDRRLFWPPTLQ